MVSSFCNKINFNAIIYSIIIITDGAGIITAAAILQLQSEAKNCIILFLH